MNDPHSKVEASQLKSVTDIRRLGIFPSVIEVPKKPLYEFFTAVYNVTSAGLGLLVLSPLMLFITVAVKLSSRPALYRGQRVGRNERIFNILKFRTMKVGLKLRSENAWSSKTKTITLRLDDFFESTDLTNCLNS